jgi:hypothetical protein
MSSFHPGVPPLPNRVKRVKQTKRLKNVLQNNCPPNPSLLQAFRIAMTGVNERPFPGNIRMIPRRIPHFLKSILFTQDRTFKEWYALCDTYETWNVCKQEEWAPGTLYNPFIHSAATGRLLRTEIESQMKLRFIARKWIARIRTRLYARRLIGDTDLRTLEPIAPQDAIRVFCLKTKSVYQFHVFSLIRMIQENLSFEQWGLAKPMVPRNPYTNQRWSTVQLLHIFHELHAQMGRRGKSLPSLLIKYVESRYCVRKFLETNSLELGIQAATRFFKTTDSDAIRTELLYEMFQQVYQIHNMRIYRLIKAKLCPDFLQKEWESLILNKWIHDNYGYSPQYMWRDTLEQNLSIEQLIHRTNLYMPRPNAQQSESSFAILLGVVIPLPEPLPESSDGEESVS